MWHAQIVPHVDLLGPTAVGQAIPPLPVAATPRDRRQATTTRPAIPPPKTDQLSGLPTRDVSSIFWSFHCDLIAAEVVRGLEAEAVSSILLKGPSISRWLYNGVVERPYSDVDLLIAPDSLSEANEILESLGFDAPPADLTVNQPRAGREWERRSDGGVVDLHPWLEGIGLGPTEAWHEFHISSVEIEVAGVQMRTLNEAARVLHLGLHAAQSGPAERQPLRDLARAIEIVPDERWREAVVLARRLNALPMFTAGLVLDPNGQELLTRMGIEPVMNVRAALMSSSTDRRLVSAALGWEWLSSRKGIVQKTGYVLRKLFPPVSWMKARSDLARKGWVGLCGSYLIRWRTLVTEAVPGYRIWRSTRHATSRPKRGF